MHPEREKLQKETQKFFLTFAIWELVIIAIYVLWWLFNSEQDYPTLGIGLSTIVFGLAAFYLIPNIMRFAKADKELKKRGIE
ncbi:MAG: hypothetical protein ACWA5L_06090 [bacterium]